MNEESNSNVEAGYDEVSQIEGEGAELEEQSENDSLQIPVSFSGLLSTNKGSNLSSRIALLQGQTRPLMPDYSAIVRSSFTPVNERIWEQMIPIAMGTPVSSMFSLNLPSLYTPVNNTAFQEMCKKISQQRTSALESLWKSLGPLFGSGGFSGLNRTLLPPNLVEYADEITASEVYEFVEQEGIPLYLVPRGRTALRLLRAENRAGRRQVLSDCYESLIDDCSAVLEQVNHPAVTNELGFVLEGLGAMRAGYTCSAQALFTVTLDTLISHLYRNQQARKTITNRKRGEDIPDVIDEMAVWKALVSLPIWNAHETFWKDKGDKVPYYYSRHASVHSVSSRQFSKRNCVQVLMLVTSLIGYADRIVRESD